MLSTASMLAACHGLIAQANTSTFWLPSKGSTVANDVDWVFYLVYWVNVFFFLLIAAMTITFVIRYRHRKGQGDNIARGAAHSTALELTWTVVPTLIVIGIFYYAFRGFLDIQTAPNNAMEIMVSGKMWNWEFTYPNGHVDPELHVPKDVPVRFVLQSADVIHSFFVPNWRVKMDVVPGRYNKVWAQATEEGTFPIYCAEYCGTQHSQMRTQVTVHSLDGYLKWLEDASNPYKPGVLMSDIGRSLYTRRGCTQCHSIDGTRLVGPSFRDLFGRNENLRGGGSVPVDENYIRESIYEPGAKVVDGYDPTMPSYKGSLKDKDVDAIIAYLKTISTHYKGPPEGRQVGQSGMEVTNPPPGAPARVGPTNQNANPSTAPVPN